MARQTPKEVHATDFLPGDHDDAIDFADVASINYMAGGAVEVVTEREWANDAEGHRFMQEPLTIEIHTTPDKNAPIYVECGSNGHQLFFVRGRRYKNVPRKFVESLARSRTTRFSTKRVNNHDSDDQMRTRSTTAMDYGFSVLHDPNPKGRQWLERVMREG